MSILRYLDLPNLTSIVCDYGYSDKLVAIIKNELQILLNRIDNHILSFDSNVVMKDFEIYKNLKII